MDYLMTLCTSLPMGDDTPIVLYASLGGLALLLLIGSAILSKKSKKK